MSTTPTPATVPFARRVWLITGCSSGFGRAIAEAALGRGDGVVATARRPESLADLVAAAPDGAALALPLDVTQPAQVRETVDRVIARFGRIDVLVNNAGYGAVGAVEEMPEDALRRQFEANFFGAVALTRAALPHMRARRSGAIVQMSSYGGQVSVPGFGPYCATKFALEGLSEALAGEVAPLGIRVLIVEPGAFRTGFGGRGMYRAPEIADYRDATRGTRAAVASMDGTQPGDPAKAARAILEALDAADPPLRLPLGPDAIAGIEAKLESVRREVDRWRRVGMDTALDAAPSPGAGAGAPAVAGRAG